MDLVVESKDIGRPALGKVGVQLLNLISSESPISRASEKSALRAIKQINDSLEIPERDSLTPDTSSVSHQAVVFAICYWFDS